MNTKSLRSVVLAAAMLVGSTAVSSATETPKEDAAMAAKLMTAIGKSDYEAFISDGEAPFRELRNEQFAAVSAQLAPKLLAAHEVSYLGELKQKGYRVTLWRLRFKDGTDDALAMLSMKSGKVGGFVIR